MSKWTLTDLRRLYQDELEDILRRDNAPEWDRCVSCEVWFKYSPSELLCDKCKESEADGDTG